MKINIAITFVLIINTLLVLSQPDGYKEVKDTLHIKQKINEVSEGTNTILADFVQEKNITFLYEKIISKGSLVYEKPEKLRLEYKEPFYYLLIMNSGKLSINTGESKMEYDLKSSKMFNEINNLIIHSIHGTILNNPDYNVWFYENTDTLFIQLSPKQEELSKYIKMIGLYIAKNDYAVSKLKITEQSDDYTLITFVNKKLNEAIPPESFYVN